MRTNSRRPRRSMPTAPRSSCPSGCCATSRAAIEAALCLACDISTSPDRDSGGRIGQSTREATLLVKVACQAAVGKRPHVSVFGTDYPTAGRHGRARLHPRRRSRHRAPERSRLPARGGASAVLNCGYGHGYSVREVLASVERIAGHPLKVVESPRRAGRSPRPGRAGRPHPLALGWHPRLDDLDTIVRTSLSWERQLQKDPGKHAVKCKRGSRASSPAGAVTIRA